MTSAFIFLRSWVAETVEMTEMPLDVRGFGCNQAKPSITASKRGSHHVITALDRPTQHPVNQLA